MLAAASSTPPSWKEDEWEHVQSHSGEVSGMLPSKGWQRHLDAKTGCYFLYNPLTGESLWEEDEQAVMSSLDRVSSPNKVISDTSEDLLGLDPDEPFDLSFENESTYDRIWSVFLAILEDFNCDNLAMLPLGVTFSGGVTILYVSTVFCVRARDCGVGRFPTLTYAVKYGGPGVRLMWQSGLATTAFFLWTTTAVLATRFRSLVPLSRLPGLVFATGTLTSASLVVLSGASIAKQRALHSVGAIVYWSASWLFVASTYALRRVAWRNRRPVLPPPFDIGGRCPANKWTACAAAVAVPGATFALLGLYLVYSGNGEKINEEVHHAMAFIGLVQQITVLFQLLFVGSLWSEIVATGAGAAVYSAATESSSSSGDTQLLRPASSRPGRSASAKRANPPRRDRKSRRRGEAKDSDIHGERNEDSSSDYDEESGGRRRRSNKTASKKGSSKKRSTRKGPRDVKSSSG